MCFCFLFFKRNWLKAEEAAAKIYKKVRGFRQLKLKILLSQLTVLVWPGFLLSKIRVE